MGTTVNLFGLISVSESDLHKGQTWADGLYYTVLSKIVFAYSIAFLINFSYIYIIIKDLIII